MKNIKTKDFTLIELMLVIAIIGILSTILIPALSKAREKSLSAVCKNQMRQCGVSISLYLNDWDNWMPAVNGHGASKCQHGWRRNLAKYMDDVKPWQPPFKCPSSNLSFNTWPGHDAGTSYNREFGDSRFKSRPGKKVTEMELPTETAVIGDSIDWAKKWAVASRLLKPSSSADPIPVGNRHYGGINILWGDFSVRWMSQSELRTGKNGNIDYYYLVRK
ncbi:MAG: type II secretion system GspH family protein [Lentisphaerales bacterium]|nr:type II secretion system GspH family protein [Lentisphaerales bacterium]